MKFPINSRTCNELLSDYYQRLEDFVKLTSDHYLQIDYHIKHTEGEEWHSGRINYNELGNIIKEDRFNQSGELVDSSKYEFLRNKIVRISKEEKSTWIANENNILIEEIHEYDFDDPDIYKFTLNKENQLESINNEIKLIWEKNQPRSLIKISNLDPIKSIIKKTKLESKILNIVTNEITSYKYTKYGSLIEIKSNNRTTSINYFGYDMMSGSETKTNIGKQISYKGYNETTLIDNKIEESVTKFFDDGTNLSSTVREKRLMK